MLKSKMMLVLVAGLLLGAATLANGATAAPSAAGLVIQSATYGAVDGSQKADVTEKVRQMVKEGNLALDASSAAFGGDPAQGKVKQLRVEYTLDGKAKTLVVGEGQHATLPAGPPLSPAEMEAKAIAVLKSDAPQKDKADACRDLAHVGTKTAVAPLAALLGDEKFSHMARYGLETIPDPSVDETFRDALGKLKGRPLVGVIGSIGVRRDAKATEALAKFLGNADPEVAQQAARSLGKIGTSEAAKAIGAAVDKTPPANQVAFCDGLFRCAEAMVVQGQKDEALSIYDRLRAMQAPHQVREGGLRGAILTRGKDGLPLLVETLHGQDASLVEAAARAAMEMKCPEVTAALVAELPKLVPDRQILVIQILGNRRDAAAMPILLATAKEGEKKVRVAAIRAFPEIGGAAAAPVLVSLLDNAEAEIAQAAQASLAALPGAEVDTAIAALLAKPEPKIRTMAIEMIGQRRTTSTMPVLVKMAEDADDSVRAAGLKVLGDLGGAAELPVMLNLLVKAKPSEIPAAEGAITAICLRQTDREACADKFNAALPQAQGPAKLALLRALRAVGGAKALEVVRAAAKDSNTEVKDTALRSLCDWPTVDAMPDVIALSKTSTDAKVKILALRGYIRLIPLQNVSDDKKVAALKEAMTTAERKEEKRLVLASLGSVPSAEALALVMPNLDSPDLKEEASLAAVEIAEKIVDTNAAVVAAAMPKVQKATANKQVLKRANEALAKAKAAAK
jgi:HEAT repeat protein